MYPDRVEKADMSAARRNMMARRRRSLTILAVGTFVGLLWGVAAGGMLAWTVGTLFLLGLGGYLTFLRNQALHDRDRRQARVHHTQSMRGTGYDATGDYEYFGESNSVVRIDDDDVELLGMAETIDLTGLYPQEQFDEIPMRRAV